MSPSPQNTLRIEDELRSIEAVLGDLLGLPSNWNGQVTLVEGRTGGFLGKKRFSCGIEIDAELATQELRWRTLIHELLHAHSRGYNSIDFQGNMGWEEGVVEHLQRRLRPMIFARLGLQIDDEALRWADASHPYNPYLDDLEEIRSVMGIEDTDATEFYRELLALPIRDRSPYVASQGRFSPLGHVTFIRLFSAANSRLKTVIRP